uniref:Uncharacterized protein n=1 Tax=Wuchereria bancrofti TaxID=6293 RepID=A0AAF5PQ75_WUCBA
MHIACSHSSFDGNPLIVIIITNNKKEQIFRFNFTNVKMSKAFSRRTPFFNT